MLKSDWGGGEDAEHSDIKKQNSKLRIFPGERSLKDPYKKSLLLYFLRGWEKRAMSCKAATLTRDTGVQMNPDPCFAWGSLVRWTKTGYPKLQPLPCHCLCEPHAIPLRGQGKHSRAESVEHKNRDQSFKHTDFSTQYLQNGKLFSLRTPRRRIPLPLLYIIL